MKYPIILFVFKRPELLDDQLDQIKAYNPKSLYIYADGPRNEAEKIATNQVHLIINKFATQNKNIHIITKYSAKNIGLKHNIVNGLNYIFHKEAAAIVLEDDCVPSNDFFRFASSMLAKYANNSRIMSVAGTSVGSYSQSSYDFSRYQLCWGWATWARAWRLYDPDMKNFRSKDWQITMKRVTKFVHMRWYWDMMLAIVKSGWLKTWDYQWTYSLFIHDGLAIIPGLNLVSNIGFDKEATNTKVKSNLANMKRLTLDWPLIHPQSVADNEELSRVIEAKFYNNWVAIFGMLRQYIYWKFNTYAHRH